MMKHSWITDIDETIENWCDKRRILMIDIDNTLRIGAMED